MSANREAAVTRFEQKRYNCCQAVICAYSERFGVKEEDVFRLTEGFGLGMGGLEDTCGAVVGMFLTISLAGSAGDMDHPLTTKKETYGKVMEAAGRFKEKKGSLYCRDLRVQEGAQPLPCCTQCVAAAAEVLEEMGII